MRFIPKNIVWFSEELKNKRDHMQTAENQHLEGIAKRRDYFETSWQRFITIHYGDTQTTHQRSVSSPDPLHEVIRYAASGAGKRIRPLMAMLTSELFECDFRAAVLPATSIEMIHTYSLIHDDLPIIDNDDLRRGRPTAHKKFTDAQALLAGDALLTDAFRILTDQSLGGHQADFLPPACGEKARLAMVYHLALAAGGHGMVHGQALDVASTGQKKTETSSSMSLDLLIQIHQEKTGALMGAACSLGALAANASDAEAAHMDEFGRTVGLAFQVVDDLLDLNDGTGKTAGKDQRQGKLSFISVVGADRAKSISVELTDKAISMIGGFHDRAPMMKVLLQAMLSRQA